MLELLAQITYDPVQRWGPVSPHGIGTAVGFLAGAWLMARRAESRGIPRTEVYNAVTWGALGAILGARLFYILPRIGEFESFGAMLRIWEGGLTMFGGFVGGLLLGLGYLWRRKFNIPQALEAAAPGFAVGVIIGRIGDLIIADHLGDRTDFFLGYRIPPPPAEIAPGYGPPHFLVGEVYHHTALYDLVGALALLGVIYLVGRRRPPAPTLFGVFSLWYGLQRLALDFTRNTEVIESAFLWFSGSQWAGMGFALAGAVMLRQASRSPSKDEPPSPVPVTAPAASAEGQPTPQAPPEGQPEPTAEQSPPPATEAEPQPEPTKDEPPKDEPPKDEPPEPPPSAAESQPPSEPPRDTDPPSPPSPPSPPASS